MLEPVILDYDGTPVSIEEGELLEWYPDDGEHWNPDTRQFEPNDDDEFDDDDYGNAAKLYGRGWYDCNTDWRNWK